MSKAAEGRRIALENVRFAAKQGVIAGEPIQGTLEEDLARTQAGYENITRQIEAQERIIESNLSGNPDSYARRTAAENTRRELVQERQNVYGQRLEFLKQGEPQKNLAEFRTRAQGYVDSPSTGGLETNRGAIGGGKIGAGDAKGTIVSVSKAEAQVGSGYYSGTPTLDTRVTNIFAPPPDYPTKPVPKGGYDASSVLPSSKAFTSIQPQKLVGAKAGVKKVIPPIQNRELRDSTITARQFKEIRAGRLTEAEAIAQNQTRGRPTEIVSFTPPAQTRISTRVLGDVLPSDSAFLSLGGVGSSNLLPQASAQTIQDPLARTISDIKKSGAKQVTIITPSGRKITTSVDRAQDQILGTGETGTFNFSFFGGKTKQERSQQISNLKQNQQQIKDIIKNARESGANEITIIDEKGKRTTVPISRAFYDITKIGQNNKTLNFEYGGLTKEQLQTNITTLAEGQKNIRDIVSKARSEYADEITITREDGSKITVPISKATQILDKETATGKTVEISYEPTPPPITLSNIIESRTKLKGTVLYDPLLSAAKGIDQFLELDRPVKRRSTSDLTIPRINLVVPGVSKQDIGNLFIPTANLAAGAYDLGRIIKGKAQPTGKKTEPLGLPEYKMTPQQRDPFIDPFFEGRFPDLTKREVRAAAAGQIGPQIIFSSIGGLASGRGPKGGGIRPSDSMVKLKIKSSYEVPSIMRKPSGEKPSDLNLLYRDTVRLETPGKRSLKERIERNIATNVINRRLDELVGKGAEGAAVEYNPRTERIGKEYIRFNLGRGEGFFTGSRGSGFGGGGGKPGGSSPGLGDVSRGVNNILKAPRIEEKPAKITAPTPDIFSMETYDELASSQPRFASTVENLGVGVAKKRSTIQEAERLAQKRKIPTLADITDFPFKARIRLGQGKQILPEPVTTMKPDVKFPELKITPVKETKQLPKRAGLQLKEKTELDKQLEKITIRLDTSSALKEKFPNFGFKSTKINLGLGEPRIPFAPGFRIDVMMKSPKIGFRSPMVGIFSEQKQLPKQKSRLKQRPLIEEGTRIRSATLVVPITGQPQRTDKITIPGLDTPQKRKTRTITIPIFRTPQETKVTIENPPGKPRRGGFFFLPFGGRGSGGSRPYRRKRTSFYTNPSDPLRAGVILTAGVPELESYSPKIFKQVDLLLAKARKAPGAFGGIDAEQFKGFGPRPLIKNLRIKI